MCAWRVYNVCRILKFRIIIEQIRLCCVRTAPYLSGCHKLKQCTLFCLACRGRSGEWPWPALGAWALCFSPARLEFGGEFGGELACRLRCPLARQGEVGAEVGEGFSSAAGSGSGSAASAAGAAAPGPSAAAAATGCPPSSSDCSLPAAAASSSPAFCAIQRLSGAAFKSPSKPVRRLSSALPTFGTASSATSPATAAVGSVLPPSETFRNSSMSSTCS